MSKVNEDNYHTFLTFHGLDPECAKMVVEKHDNTKNYHNIQSVKNWVEASKIVLKKNKE